MFFGPPLSVIFELAENYILHRRHPNGLIFQLDGLPVQQTPMMQLVFACEINIRPKTGLVVD